MFHDLVYVSWWLEEEMIGWLKPLIFFYISTYSEVISVHVSQDPGSNTRNQVIVKLIVRRPRWSRRRELESIQLVCFPTWRWCNTESRSERSGGNEGHLLTCCPSRGILPLDCSAFVASRSGIPALAQPWVWLMHKPLGFCCTLFVAAVNKRWLVTTSPWFVLKHSCPSDVMSWN